MRILKFLLAAVALVPVFVIGSDTAAHAARGIASPTTPAYGNVGPAPTYWSQYTQDYGDPRCPSNVDESKNKCFTYYFAIGFPRSDGNFAPVNPQKGCGTQDNCTYRTDMPCPADQGEGPLTYQAQFRQYVVPSDGSAPWLDIRFSSVVTLNPCPYHFITP